MRRIGMMVYAFITGLSSVILAQGTPGDTAHVKSQRIVLDSVSVGLHRYCATSSAAKYMQPACRNYIRLAAGESALLIGKTPPPPPPVVSTDSAPVATAPTLPQHIPMIRDPFAGRACTVNVSATGDVNAAVAAAHNGAVICPASGAHYGALVLPKRPVTDTVVIRSTCALPPEGTRVTPVMVSLIGCFPKFLSSSNASQAVIARAGANGYVLRGLELTTDTNVVLTYQLVVLGSGTADQAVADSLPNNILLEQDYIHTSATAEMQRCVQFNGGSLAIVDSWVDECHGKGYDSQAIGGWSGLGPYYISNNYLAGAGENILLGGARPAAEGLVPSDITITRNWIRTPPEWANGRWTKKLLLELKSAHRVLIEGNVLDGSWVDGQTGYGIWVKSSIDGPFHGMNTTDVMIRNNRMTHTGSGIAVTGRENYEHPDWQVQYPAENTARIRIENNWVDSVNQVAPYLGDGRLFLTGGLSRGVQDLSVVRNTIVSTATLNAAFLMTGVPPAITRLDFQRNVMTEGQYGVVAEDSSQSSHFGEAVFPWAATPSTYGRIVFYRQPTNGGVTYGPETSLTTSLAGAWTTGALLGAGADTANVNVATSGVVTPGFLLRHPTSTRRIPVEKPPMHFSDHLATAWFGLLAFLSIAGAMP